MPRLPRTGWAAVGVALGAAWAAAGLAAAGRLVGGLLLVAVATVHDARVARVRVPLLAVGVGAVLVAIRVLAGPTAPPPAPLPEDGGPWTGVVESVGSPRDGGRPSAKGRPPRHTFNHGQVHVDPSPDVFLRVSSGSEAPEVGACERVHP